MSKREKLPELRSTGNWVGAPKKKETAKKKPVGQGAKPAKPAKPAASKARIGAGAKPKAKPAQAKKTTSAANTKAQDRSGDAALGQGRKSPAASKMNRQPGYSSASNKSAKMNKYEKRKQARTGRK